MASIWDSLPTRTAENVSPLAREHRERAALFAMYWNYYRGKHKKHLKVKPGQADDNVILNYSKRVVNKGVTFLYGKPVEFEIDNSDGRTAEEEYLDLVWGGNERKMALLQNIALNGGVCGTAFVRIYPEQPGVRDSLPRLVNLDPSTVDVISNEDDIEDVRAYHQVWRSGEDWKRHRIDMQDNGDWFITEEETRSGGSVWQVTDESAWAYPFPPILTIQNLPSPNEVWGISDLEEADLNDAINFTASNISRILRFHSHPKTIGTGFGAKTLESTAVEEFWTIPNEAAKVFNLEMDSDLQSAYAYLQELRNAYAKITSVPELDPNQVNVGAMSGFALRILYGDLLEATMVKRNTYGGMMAEANRRLLVLAGRGDFSVANVWADPLPANIVEQAQALTADRAAGLSLETYLERRGYDAEREQQRIEEEATQQAQQQDSVGGFLLRAFDRGAVDANR